MDWIWLGCNAFNYKKGVVDVKMKTMMTFSLFCFDLSPNPVAGGGASPPENFEHLQSLKSAFPAF